MHTSKSRRVKESETRCRCPQVIHQDPARSKHPIPGIASRFADRIARCLAHAHAEGLVGENRNSSHLQRRAAEEDAYFRAIAWEILLRETP
jgi:hypothetical protein